MQAGMAHDMVSLLSCRARFSPRYALMKGALLKNKPLIKKLQSMLMGESNHLELARREANNMGGFLPLMPRLPLEDDSGTCDVDWSERDWQLRAWMREREQGGEGGTLAAGAAGVAAD
jgi:hypothetical protein